uniref:Uncharacterized protein n=1 Tax=Pyramimonas obovata TaxID=1411642 RepID=A0A7S0RAP1_9CHLO|mmetsp:Transcript_29569/g.64547  ORF Transcript_29569/g.64547 Transcript_29569/m.64547 type:complete len:329 (+) Transcript_29569:278-1264(+)|eukprot:CAMPEP_0118958954 /NCGR_PEP_ID=MMETSP1169-20130426/62886_1 /TAXON_ID=36882 /ORGANISM="Pyramimonas obovata, Strain CCMP722" /LENGTH=328 /DNA_ID=CAMNT_0006907081 /DNA_START=236 /DNA_END=1222 /DNA_ORIENTATION=-
MVLGIKKDPSTDLGYSSLAVDKKSWNKSFSLGKADRFASHSFNAIHGLTNKNRIDAVYDARKGLADEIKHSNYKGNIYRSKMPKSVDINSSRCGDPRASNTKVPFPYAKPLGPGSYNNEKLKKHSAPGGMLDPKRESACFSSLPRPPMECGNPVPDVSDVLTRDMRNWTSRGFTSSRSQRFANMSLVNDTGKYRSLCNFGGLFAMAQKGRIPAFDAEYDADTGAGRSIGRTVREGPNRCSIAFRSNQDRLMRMPSHTPDTRLRNMRTTCDEWIGPGTYDAPGPYIGTENIHTGTATGMFDSTFRGEVRFNNRGGYGFFKDSSLLRGTW